MCRCILRLRIIVPYAIHASNIKSLDFGFEVDISLIHLYNKKKFNWNNFFSGLKN